MFNVIIILKIIANFKCKADDNIGSIALLEQKKKCAIGHFDFDWLVLEPEVHVTFIFK